MLKKSIAFFVFSLLVSPMMAGWAVDADLGVAATIGNDDLYFRINARYFDRDHATVVDAAKRLKDPDHELPIVLFLAYHSKKDEGQIIHMRKSGLSYWDISVKLGIPPRAYFVDLAFDPGPPYGKAYGHWKRHGHRHAHRIVLTEREMYDLISLQIASNYYDLPPRDVIKMRDEGKELKMILTDEYRKRHTPPGHMKEKQKMKKYHEDMTDDRGKEQGKKK